MSESSANYLVRMQAATAKKGRVDLWPAASSVKEAVADLDGVVDPKADVLVWASNNRHPMADMVAAWLFLGLITEAQALSTDEARATANVALIAAYRAAQPAQPSAEEMYEMRAAFGPGETVVDVLTGRRVTL
jgi:hypothetical protein